MSRAPTDLRQYSPQTTPLQPQANPTNQFATPNIVRGGGGSLLSLANSLRSLVPEIQGVMDRRTQAYQQAGAAQATADKSRWKNVQDFKDAVARGEVPESQNPWYAIQTKQLLATDKMQQASETAMDAVLKNAKLRDSDNPDDIRNFVQQHMQSAASGMDPWEAEVAVPMAQQAVAGITNRQMNMRDGVRQIEQEHAAKRAILDNLKGIDPNSPPEVKQVAQENLQHLMGQLLLTSNKVKVNDWFKEAISDSAMDRRDVGMLQFYKGLKKEDGTPVPGEDIRVHETQLGREIAQRKVQDMSVEREKQAAISEKIVRSLDSELGKQQQEWQKTAKPGEWFNFAGMKMRQDMITKMYAEGHYEAADRLQNGVMSYIAATSGVKSIEDKVGSEETMKKYGVDMLSGKLPPEQWPSVAQMFINNNDFIGWENLARTHQYMKSMEWGQVTPDTMKAITDRMAGTDPEKPFDLKFINDLGADRKIDLQTYNMLFSHFQTMQNAGGKHGAAMQTVSAQIGMLDSYLDTAVLNRLGPEVDPDTAQRALSSPVLKANKESARTAMLNQGMAYLNSPDYLAHKQDLHYVQEKLAKIASQVSHDNDGLTAEEHDAWRQKNRDRMEKKAMDAANEQAMDKMPVPVFKPEEHQSAMVEQIAAGNPLLKDLKPQMLGAGKQVLQQNVPPLGGRDVVALAAPLSYKEREIGFKSMWGAGSWEQKDPSGLAGLRASRNGAASYGGGGASGGTSQMTLEDERQSADHVRSIAGSMEYSLLQRQAPEKYAALVTKGMKTPLTASEWVTLRQLDNQMGEVALLRKYAGYDVNDGLQMGPDSWKKVPLFTDEEALKNGGAAAMVRFKLDPNSESDVRDFRTAQVMAIHRMRIQD